MQLKSCTLYLNTPQLHQEVVALSVRHGCESKLTWVLVWLTVDTQPKELTKDYKSIRIAYHKVIIMMYGCHIGLLNLLDS